MQTDAPHGGVLWRPLFDYRGDNDDIVASLQLPNVIPGFDDAGAHCTILTDATCATTNVQYYGKDRAGVGSGTVPIEQVVKTQTRDATAIFGLDDRGVLAAGMRADINVIDLAALRVKSPYWANDLPTGAGRWLQYTEGYRYTILRGALSGLQPWTPALPVSCLLTGVSRLGVLPGERRRGHLRERPAHRGAARPARQEPAVHRARGRRHKRARCAGRRGGPKARSLAVRGRAVAGWRGLGCRARDAGRQGCCHRACGGEVEDVTAHTLRRADKAFLV